MTMLNQLKSGVTARIVSFEKNSILKEKFVSNGITEDSIIRIISCYGLITFSVDSKIFSVSCCIAEKVRVIELKT